MIAHDADDTYDAHDICDADDVDVCGAAYDVADDIDVCDAAYDVNYFTLHLKCMYDY
jgi:hypothetical protein